MLFPTRVKEHKISGMQTATATSASNMRLPASAEITWKKLIDEDGLLPAISEDIIENYFIHLREDDGLERQDWKSVGLLHNKCIQKHR